VEIKLKEIEIKLRQASSNINDALKLMTEYKNMQELRNMIAKKLGSDIIN
jgi:DNA primase